MSRIPLLILVAALAPAPVLAATATPRPEPALSAWTVDLGHTDAAPAAGASSPIGARAWQVTFDAAPIAFSHPARTLDTRTAATAASAQRPVAVTYSDGYTVRAKIHKVASFATLPLFVSEYIVGKKLYDGNVTDSTRSVHGALAGGIAGLFAVNTVTGVWNLVEARRDPNGRARRWVHGLLMLAADAGFAATGMLAPESEDGLASGNRSLHRNVAIASMSLATAGYLVMLLPH